jgi:hypothetical protein
MDRWKSYLLESHTEIRFGAGQKDFRYFSFSVLMVATPMTVTP